METKKLLILTQAVDKKDSVLGFFHAWISEFSKNYEKVTVICLNKGEYDFPLNVEVLSLGKEVGVSKIKYLAKFYSYIFFHRKNYNEVFVHMNPIYVILGGLFWKIMGKKVSLWYTHKCVDWKLIIAERIADVIFTASKESFRLKSKKVHIMGHGIDMEKFSHSYIDKKPDRVLSLGRISPIKDIKTAIFAIKELNIKSHNVTLDIIGSTVNNEDQEYFVNLKQLVSNEGLTKKVNFLGPVYHDEIPNILKNYSYLVHTSNTGSLDKVALEAMAASLIVISCNDSVKSIFDYDEKICFEKGDYKHLSKNISDLIDMRASEREVIAEQYLSFVREEHSLQSLIKRITFLYEK